MDRTRTCETCKYVASSSYSDICINCTWDNNKQNWKEKNMLENKPLWKPTVNEIEEYMASLNIPQEKTALMRSEYGKAIPGANDKQVSGKHYKEKTIQPWDYIYANNLGYFEGNCVKYVSRWRDKGGIADLQKAIHYLEKLIELENNKQ